MLNFTSTKRMVIPSQIEILTAWNNPKVDSHESDPWEYLYSSDCEERDYLESSSPK
jgi:hypothetical protein